MTSLRQIEANRRNARLSSGPITEEGKKRSRQNALRHGLTAETVIDALEEPRTMRPLSLPSLPTTTRKQPSKENSCSGWQACCGGSVGPPRLKAACSRSRRDICFGSGNRDEARRNAKRSSTAHTEISPRAEMKTSSPPAWKAVQRRSRRRPIYTTISRKPSSACRICRPIPSTG